MYIFYTAFSQFFLNRPFLVLLTISLITSTVLRLFFYKYSHTKISTLIILFACLFFTYYFGLLTTFKLIFIFFTISIVSDKYDIAWITIFFITVQLYIVTGLMLSPQVSQNILTILGVVIIILNTKNAIVFVKNLSIVKNFFLNLNVFELFVLVVSFLLGSIPQNKYDAIHANLYNAKTYITTNSFIPLPENTSSLFPQNAIIYYSYFYQLGQEKGLQIAYLLPLVITIFCIKKLKIKPVFSLPFLLTPIIIFEASNGYYDLLMTSLLLSAATILFTSDKNFRPILSASFLIGFASGSKYFPIFITILPVLALLFTSKRQNLLLKISAILLLVLFPLSLWLIRSYAFTHNPVFPFMQNTFPTPNIWEKSDVLENNPMIKTPINLKQWATGAFAYYPVTTYFNTISFVEELQKFPTLIYIIILPLQLFLFFKIILKLVTKKTIENIDITLFSLFLGYYFTGFITRYYRYLWPFQFTLAIFSILYVQNILKNSIKSTLILSIIFVFVLPFNLYQIFNHLRPYYNFNSKLFQPNYYHTSPQVNDPIVFLNRVSNNNTQIKTMDASKYMLGRFHFSSRIYQCNWYWYDKVIDIIKHKNDKTYGNQILNQFEYIITNNPPEEGNNLCLSFLLPELSKYQKIYQDTYYQIYSTKK